MSNFNKFKVLFFTTFITTFCVVSAYATPVKNINKGIDDMGNGMLAIAMRVIFWVCVASVVGIIIFIGMSRDEQGIHKAKIGLGIVIFIGVISRFVVPFANWIVLGK